MRDPRQEEVTRADDSTIPPFSRSTHGGEAHGVTEKGVYQPGATDTPTQAGYTRVEAVLGSGKDAESASFACATSVTNLTYARSRLCEQRLKSSGLPPFLFLLSAWVR